MSFSFTAAPWRADNRFLYRPAVLLLGTHAGYLEQLRSCLMNRYTVSSADQLSHGLDLAQLLVPVAVFVTGPLLDASALRVLERFKRDASLHRLPLIMMTAAEDESLALQQAGAATVLQCPLRDPDIVAVAERWALPRQPMQQAVRLQDDRM